MTSATFRLSDSASSDIENIWISVFDRSSHLEVADKVVLAIFEGISFLGDNPEAGHYREDLFPAPTKFWSIYGYLIVYQVDSPLEIIRVLPGQMDIEAILSGNLN